jgi:hypothetical protein
VRQSHDLTTSEGYPLSLDQVPQGIFVVDTISHAFLKDFFEDGVE